MKHEQPPTASGGATPPPGEGLPAVPPAPVPAGGAVWRRSAGLSGKLLLLTVLFVMLSEVFVYVPSVANFRSTWLKDKLTTAGVAAAVLSETNTIAPRLQEELMRVTGAVAISLTHKGRRSLIAMSGLPEEIRYVIDMEEETPWSAIRDSVEVLFSDGSGLMRVSQPLPMGSSAGDDVQKVDIVLPVAMLRKDMLAFSGRILGLTLIISVITASLVYLALRWMFVRPLQRLSASMARFAEDPEDTARIIVPGGRDDEIGDAEKRLADMQRGLSRALHQKQRLADLGLAVSKINHDLRNLLASAQLFMERIEHVPDPTVKRLVPKILATLDRAVGYTQAVMAYGKAREEPPRRRLIRLERVVSDVAELLALAEHPGIEFESRVAEGFELEADPEQLFRVLVNLCRNAVQAMEAGADAAHVCRLTIEAALIEGECLIRVRDTGPGIPPAVRAGLFRAFQSGAKNGGTGLGLAIALEIVRAHGGRLVLEDTGPGTTFCIQLPQRAAPEA
ncbi:sensor histidine kinase [Pannonibacter indicus]|uniref:sensor histidine kinase n=1 Tax=Pannonibacter indicus TaxID=466044 RepID=UPI0035ADEDC9